MAIGFKDALGLLKQTFKDFGEDECPRLAAALSYYTVFALPPLLILILLVVGLIWDRNEVAGALQEQMGGMMGSSAAQEVGTMIASQDEKTQGKGLGAVLGIAAVVFGATGAFLQLQGALNRAWEVRPDPKSGGIKNFVFKRMLSLGFILGVAFLLLVSLAVSALLSAAGGMVSRFLPGGELLGHVINFAISFVVITLLFAAIFKVLPDARVEWRDVWVGAVVTGLLFMIGKFALGIYLGRSNPGEAFGAAGSLALILVWIYYSSMIVLFGAEFTQVWVKYNGRTIEPEEGAIKVVEETREVRPGQVEKIPQPKEAK